MHDTGKVKGKKKKKEACLLNNEMGIYYFI